jgi:hypothetical protein
MELEAGPAGRAPYLRMQAAKVAFYPPGPKLLALRGVPRCGDECVQAVRSGVHRNRILEAVQNLVRGVLQAGVRLVELTGRLGGELAELVTVVYVGKGSKNQV